MNIQLSFTNKQIEIIGMMAPNLTPTEICQRVMDDWFANNLQMLHKTVKTQAQIIDEVIAANADKPMVK